MKVVVAGAGRIGRSLADRLSERLWDVTVIDKSPDRCSVIIKSNLTSFCGDASDPELLQEAGAGGANIFFALTSDDTVNIEACRIALDEGAERAIARCDDPSNLGTFDKYGIKTVSPTELTVDVLEDMFENPRLSSSLHVAGGEGEVMELTLSGRSPVVGKRISEVPMEDVEVAALRAEEGFVIPEKERVLEEGDVVVLVGRRGIIQAASHHFMGEDAVFPRGYGETILVPLISERSLEGALAEGLIVAREALTSITSFVLDGDYLGEEAEDRAREENVNLTYLGKKEGNIVEETRAEVDRTNPAMVVVDEEEFGVMDRILRRRRSAAEMVASLPCPVLVSKRRHSFERVLLLIDGSSAYDRAAEMGVEAASLLGSEVLAVATVPPVRTGDRESAVEEAEGSLERIEKVGEIWNVPVETRVVEGNPVGQATRIARGEGIGLAVIGYKTDAEGLLKSSVSEKLLEELPVSTLVIK